MSQTIPQSANLAGKVALVTGASKGIGARAAIELAARGARVVVNYARSADAADRVVRQIIDAGGEAVAVQADLSQPDQVKQLVDKTVEAYGRVDILVNNAGVYGFGSLEEVTVDEYRRQHDLNVLGLILITQAALPHMGRGASVVNISSAVSNSGMPNVVIYSATKGAVDQISRTLAAELGPRGIRVNSVNPGAVLTEGSEGFFDEGSEFRAQIESATPLGRIGEPDDIATVVAFFASDDSKWVTGQTLNVSGGHRG